MKIGVVTIYTVPNYGSVLQAYATQKVLEKLGTECHIIDYLYPNHWHYENGVFQKPTIKSRIGKFLNLSSRHKLQRVLDDFNKTHLHLTRTYEDWNDLHQEDWSSYSAVCVGSDQVWNPRFLKCDPTFMLSFLPEETFRFSLSSSFACKSLPLENRAIYKTHLSKFKALSVREGNGVKILRDDLGLTEDAKVLLDPTLLIDSKEWLSIISKKNRVRERPYILLYMLDYAFQPQPYIWDVLSYFSRNGEYEIIALQGYTKPRKAKGCVMKDCSSSTIDEFLTLFSNASLVVTSSFHGTAFAVNFGRPLISIVPLDKADDRQTGLLKSLEIENCIVEIGTKIETINPIYDVVRTQELLNKERANSIAWINDCIKSISCGQ